MKGNKMRSTLHGPDAFLLKSKKPHIQSLVANVDNMTNEQIERLNEKPDVIKGLLNIKRQKEQESAAKRAEILADLMMQKHHPAAKIG